MQGGRGKYATVNKYIKDNVTQVSQPKKGITDMKRRTLKGAYAMYDPGLGPFAAEQPIMELTDFNGLSLSCRRMSL